jgi:hypothetical protein
MLAAHHDQENLVHGQQTVAASKLLNQSVRGLAPKTPSNNGQKTTKLPLNTEGKLNFNGRQTSRNHAKENENAPLEGKSRRADKFAFVTPVGMERDVFPRLNFC